MRELINIYCDESCHLKNDGENAMVLGAVWCKEYKKNEIFSRIKEIKAKHGLVPKVVRLKQTHIPSFEVKWNKVSDSKLEFYKELIDYFFTDDDLHFRVVVVPNKKELDYVTYNHTHDTFYYKMYFLMIEGILNPEHKHSIYIDIKDTRSRDKVHKLEDVLRNSQIDFSKQIIKKVQQIRSHEVELVQMADLLIGAISYVHRNLQSSAAKNSLVELIRHRSKYSLLRSTLIKESKFNILVWKSKPKVS
jgi:CxxC motif-containing protein